MKKLGTFLAGIALASVVSMPNAIAAEQSAARLATANPTCVLMKFTDDTRYKPIEANASLSDLVMEKMIVSGRFNLKETRPIDQNMEAMLYDEKMRELVGGQAAMGEGDFSELFEGPGFSETKAQSIATASVGQIVTPSITSAIGNAHGAEYLVQGTILNLGSGGWENTELDNSKAVFNLVTSVGSSVLGQALGGVPYLGAILGGLKVEETGIGVQSDLRLIKASTGEVVWSKRVTAVNKQKKTSLGFVSFGTTKLSENLYAKAMDKAATEIVNALIADMDAGKLFVK